MDRWLFNAAAWSAALMCAAPPVVAADAVSDAVLSCTAETSDARRLACFDALAGRMRGAPPAAVAGPTAAKTAAAAPTAALPASAPVAQAAPAPTAAPPASAPVAQAAPTAAVATVAAATGAAAPAPAARPPEVATLSAEEKFGLRGQLKEEKTGELTELSAKATAISAKPRGELVITLDNGQVWAEIAPGSSIRVKPGDPVKIEAGTLGSFILIAPNGRSSKVSRVR